MPAGAARAACGAGLLDGWPRGAAGLTPAVARCMSDASPIAFFNRSKKPFAFLSCFCFKTEGAFATAVYFLPYRSRFFFKKHPNFFEKNANQRRANLLCFCPRSCFFFEFGCGWLVLLAKPPPNTSRNKAPQIECKLTHRRGSLRCAQ